MSGTKADSQPSERGKTLCYVDETGQDTLGLFFLVALVITGEEREDLRQLLMRIEKISGKTSRKWTNATLKQRTAYLAQLLAAKAFEGKIFYREFSRTTNYLSCTVETIAQGVAKKALREYRVAVIIDRLGKREGKAVGAALRKRGFEWRRCVDCHTRA